MPCVTTDIPTTTSAVGIYGQSCLIRGLYGTRRAMWCLTYSLRYHTSTNFESFRYCLSCACWFQRLRTETNLCCWWAGGFCIGLSREGGGRESSPKDARAGHYPQLYRQLRHHLDIRQDSVSATNVGRYRARSLNQRNAKMKNALDLNTF